MRTFIKVPLIASAALASCLAIVPAGTATAAPKGSDKICKSGPGTGSRVANRVCHTRAEWDAIAEENRRSMADQVNRPMANRTLTEGVPEQCNTPAAMMC